MSNIFKITLAVLCSVTVSPVVAAPGDASKPVITNGPKVHTSKVEDQSGCDQLSDPQAAALGRTAGAVAGMKLGAGMSGSMMAAAAAEEAAVRALQLAAAVPRLTLDKRHSSLSNS